MVIDEKNFGLEVFVISKDIYCFFLFIYFYMCLNRMYLLLNIDRGICCDI